MTVVDILEDLRRRDVRVWAEGDRLRCSVPVGALTPALEDQLRRYKPELLAFLRAGRALAPQHRAIVPLQPHGTRAPIFGVPGHNGDVFCYRPLAHHVGDDQPLYGLQPPGLDGRSEPLTRIEDLAEYFAAQIRAVHPSGPRVIAGYCAGGMTAFELGRRLLQERSGVLVVLFGASHPSRYQRFRVLGSRLGMRVELGITLVDKHTRAMLSRPPGKRWAYLAEKLRRRRERRAALRSAGPDSVLRLRARVEDATLQAAWHYTPAAFGGRVVLCAPCEPWLRSREVPLRWRSVAQEFDACCGPDGCDADTMLQEPWVEAFATVLSRHAGATRKTELAAREAGG